MVMLFFILSVSWGFCLTLTPLVCLAARRLGLVDRPDGQGKGNGGPTPVVGGLVLFPSVVLAVFVAFLAGFFTGKGGQPVSWNLWGLLLAVGIIGITGLLDDLGLLQVRHKFLGQVLAAVIVVATHETVHQIQVFGYGLDLGPLAWPFTLFFLLGAINSLNLLDGMDGLLGSVGLIASLALAGMALLGGQGLPAVVAVALAGALLGFLCSNRPPATIFLGNSGSLLIGLVVGTLAMETSLEAPATLVLAAPVALLILPVFDTTAAILRRKLTGRRFYTPDLGHIHHCLLRDGYSPWKVLLLIGSFSILAALGVLASRFFDCEWIAFLTGGTVVAILIGTRLFGFAEAMLLKQWVLSLSTILLPPSPKGQARQSQVRLQGSGEWQHLWKILMAEAVR